MPVGPSKYDSEVSELRARIKADGIVLIVFGGDRGPGFCTQLSFEMTLATPKILRELAQQIEANIPELRQQMLDSIPKAAQEQLCEDCPPIGYPTDATRCIPCPRRMPLR
jgi:hypothetical protein